MLSQHPVAWTRCRARHSGTTMFLLWSAPIRCLSEAPGTHVLVSSDPDHLGLRKAPSSYSARAGNDKRSMRIRFDVVDLADSAASHRSYRLCPSTGDALVSLGCPASVLAWPTSPPIARCKPASGPKSSMSETRAGAQPRFRVIKINGCELRCICRRRQ